MDGCDWQGNDRTLGPIKIPKPSKTLKWEWEGEWRLKTHCAARRGFRLQEFPPWSHLFCIFMWLFIMIEFWSQNLRQYRSNRVVETRLTKRKTLMTSTGTLMIETTMGSKTWCGEAGGGKIIFLMFHIPRAKSNRFTLQKCWATQSLEFDRKMTQSKGKDCSGQGANV